MQIDIMTWNTFDRLMWHAHPHCTVKTLDQVLLTCFMDARVIAELQHVEVAPLHAAPDAVNARDVGAFALHCKEGSHHVLVAVMLEVWAAHQQPHQPRQESSEPGKSPPLLHGPSAQVVQHWSRGEEAGDCLRLCKTLSDVCLSPYTPNILLTPCLLFSPLVLFFLLLSLCLLPHTVPTLKSK